MAFRNGVAGVMLSGMRVVFPLALRLSLGRCLLFQLGLLATVCLLSPGSAFASSTIFGGGPFYTGGQARMNELRNAGYTTVMLWTIHLNENNGDLIYNDILVVSNGVYVGNPAWPGQLATLKQQPTSVNRIEISVGSWGVPDFERIKILMDTYGTNTTSILYRNFQALKVATGADAVDFDDESQYDVNTMVKFGRMLASIGYKVTLCPYTQPTFWQNVYNQLGPAIVDEVYLQCYAGGAGNNPATWNNYFPGLKVQPGMWSRHGGGCADGSTAAQVQAQMTSWRASAGIPGGFMWLYDDMLSCTVGGTAADYARAINTAVDKMIVLPAAGFTGVTAFNSQYIPTTTPFTITNSGATALNWSVINTSSWLTVSASSGGLAGSAATTVNISLNPAVATNLSPNTYTATVLFSNVTTKVTQARNFSLNTAIANWPVALTGFNAGILASNTATAGNPTATAFDVKNNYGFYQLGLPGSTRGLPLNGVFASKAYGSTAFQVGPFGKTNSLMLGYTYPISGTLTLTNPQAFSSLAILASSANGGGQGTFVLNFTNGTKSPVFNFDAPDWFNNVANVAVQGFGRLQLGASLNAQDNGDANPNLYQTTINLAALGLTMPIRSITFSNPANAGAQQNTAIFAVSGMPSSVPVQPPANLSATPGSNATVRLTWTPSAGATNYIVHRSTVSGSAYVEVGSTTGTTFTDAGLLNGTTYFYVVTAVGAFSESENSVEVSAMPGSYRAWTLAANPLGYWPLHETSGTTASDIVRGSNGVHGGSMILGFTGATEVGFGSPHRAVRYDGSTGHTLIPRLIGSTNFSIAFWIQTTTTGGTPQWYNGKGIVDGEVGGATGDFGVSLVGTKIGFGVGNPDTTLQSVRAINNGAWRQVVVTRDSGNGAMRIYIDGTLDASMTGPTGPKTAPPALRIGSLQPGGNYLLAAISDVAVYDRVLTPEQVAVLYSAATGLYLDVTLSVSRSGNNLVLNWPGNGRLLEANSLAGPWVTNFSAKPVFVNPILPQKFYRVRSW
jgi:hypothetical protein